MCMNNGFLGYINSFGNIGMYLVSYMRVTSKNPNTNYSLISYIYSTAVLLQSLSGFFTTFVERALGTRKATILGCVLTSLSIIACSFNLHSFRTLILYYSVLGGIASGLILPLPLDAAIRSNPSKRGYICGSIYFYSGLLCVLLTPLQTFYINKSDIRLENIITPTDREVYYRDDKLLTKLPNLFVFQGILYLFLLVSHYTRVLDIRASDERSDDMVGEKTHNFMHYLYLWLLIFLSWQSIIFLQSYWKVVALLKLDGSDIFITLIGSAASLSHVIGRILWGIIFDLIGWRHCWIILVASTLVLTFSSYILYQTNIVIYAIW
ncbi:membrane transporter, putative [Theileria annulata]|uniref:Membrane transporter, putative n=1 Tax=Theileria annulata TaxID=5874 RepID=Q4UC67_THEAN|nr:membrane transporter, putative [Theileria annulata]CAI75584.1 membrane transporter, putative [Theileria annulata]|eukprot:XP_955060.1 membrane transporter, putative [Theileria annulata]